LTWSWLILRFAGFSITGRQPPGAAIHDDDETLMFHFDSQPIQEVLGDVSFSEPDILAYLRSYLEEGLASVQAALSETV
jgi:hypothetical protein